MQNLLKLLFIALIFAGCETYGPATRYQNTRLMERPFYNGSDTAASYLSARLGNGRNYRNDDKSYAGEISLYRSWVSKWIYASVGGHAQYGRYQLKDSIALDYHSLGLRFETGFTANIDNSQIYYNIAASRSYENGSFYNYRKTFRRSDSLAPASIFKDTSLLKPLKWITDFQSSWGFKHRFNENSALNARTGVGFSFNNELAIYGFIEASYQFNKRLYANFSYVVPFRDDGTKNELKLSNIYSLGVTYSF
jgi:hypothetical protein